MKTIAFAALAALAASIPTFASTSAEAGVRVTVNPTYVPAVYCSYKSKAWVDQGIVSCPVPFEPIGEPGAKWRTSSGALMCWNTNGFGGKEYSGWWQACPRK
jgi:hypothetical protein